MFPFKKAPGGYGRWKNQKEKLVSANDSAQSEDTNRRADWHAITDQQDVADVCLIVEGCYPFVRGGVSSWLDWLIRSQPELSFSVVAIFPDAASRDCHYDVPQNLISFQQIGLIDAGGECDFGSDMKAKSALLAEKLHGLFDAGDLTDFSEIDALINDPHLNLPTKGLMNSPFVWHVICRLYELKMPQASFIDFYWGARSLLGGMFQIMRSKIPEARLYHTISTGYAGLLAAKAKTLTGKPTVISEHGIYTNERRIEILMADWIADTVNKGYSIEDDRYDLRDLWLRAFEAHARICYEACDEITTLFRGNQSLQRQFGAQEGRLQVIANGIALETFNKLPRKGGGVPAFAMVGRVVPIKDIKTFLQAAALVKQRIGNIAVYIMGPTDEDPSYFKECEKLVEELGLSDCLTFTGNVKLVDYFPKIDLIVLSSLSEAQPLVLLEAGAAGIPCVATDVGSCREIIEGDQEEIPSFGPGGIVTALVDAEAQANAICKILQDAPVRNAMSDAARKRINSFYKSQQSADKYAALYAAHGIGAQRSTPHLHLMDKEA
ncbi:MAG: GT4 family glycosyltransferase PelF [Rhodobacteraceae bacterium]|nr:GT4 family glycosyltransferase PelF [Paracoccaceae bacterium]